jgi:hydroxyethylthiazole kinase
VGSGATPYRTATARALARELTITVVRGNASEILSLAGGGAITKGVDAVHAVEDAAREGGELAVALKATLAVTGAVDRVTDGRTTLQIEGGSRLMGRVTGTGCMATVIVAAFCAVEKDPVAAAAGGLALLKLAAERAAERATAPGSFEVALRDALYELGPGDLARTDRVREVRP